MLSSWITGHWNVGARALVVDAPSPPRSTGALVYQCARNQLPSLLFPLTIKFFEVPEDALPAVGASHRGDGIVSRLSRHPSRRV